MFKYLKAIMLSSFVCLGALAARCEEMPLGVYMSWELAHAYAAENQVSLSDFLDNSLRLCHDRGVNTLWVTNIDAADLPMLQELCRRYEIRLVANACEGKEPGYYADDAAPLRFRIDQMRAAAAPELDYWILSDEPEAGDVAHLNTYAELLRQADPERWHALVVIPKMIHAVIGQVPLDMAAVDPYPFFGPNDPNGPHTPESSRQYFRETTENFIAACAANNVEPWLMPQSFAELWGPYRYEKDGMLTALPGSYLHWITPTVAQTRWQLFESLRQGAQGVIFFQLLPTMLPERGTLPMPDVAWREVLVQEETPAGFAALMTLYGKSTPQFDELGRLFAGLQKHASLLRGVQRLAAAAWPLTCPASVQQASFTQPGDNRKFMILVNDDFAKPAQIQLGDGTFQELLTEKQYRDTLELAPGDGAILVAIEDK